MDYIGLVYYNKQQIRLFNGPFLQVNPGETPPDQSKIYITTFIVTIIIIIIKEQIKVT